MTEGVVFTLYEIVKISIFWRQRGRLALRSVVTQWSYSTHWGDHIASVWRRRAHNLSINASKGVYYLIYLGRRNTSMQYWMYVGIASPPAPLGNYPVPDCTLSHVTFDTPPQDGRDIFTLSRCQQSFVDQEGNRDSVSCRSRRRKWGSDSCCSLVVCSKVDRTRSDQKLSVNFDYHDGWR